jgi:hypothetical protein
MTLEKTTYEKYRNLKLASAELGIPWQSLYARLRSQGVSVSGDKLRYGSDRDKLAAMAEQEFYRLVPNATSNNEIKWQAKWDFNVGVLKVDVKASMPRQLSSKYPALSWSFSLKKQALLCDFICCFCMSSERKVEKVLLVPKEFFEGLQTVSVSCAGGSKWLDYSVEPKDLAPFFNSLN